MSSPPSQEPPDGRTVNSGGLVAAGAAVAAALMALAFLERPGPIVGLSAALAVAAATAACVLAAARARQARQEPALGLAAAGAGEPPLVDLVDALPDPILVVAATEPDDLTSRRYVFANAAAVRLLRLEPGEGLLVNAIRDPQVLDAADQALFANRDAECVYETAGVQPLTLRVSARALPPDAKGRRTAMLAFRDETELRQVERTRVDFLANASHELRTPLASLSGFIETLRGHARDDPAAQDRFLSIMQAQAGRMARLIDDLMSLSRIELGEHIAPADRVDLAGCVCEVIEASGPLARARGVELRFRGPRKGVASVAGDRDQIVQVVQNLVDNAIKYSPDGQPVELVLQAGLSLEAASAPYRPGLPRLSLLTPDAAGGSYAALRISDLGPGAPRETLPRLTERFYRVEGQKSGERSGSGLGLAIVKHIVNRHRGGLVVESAVGQGTTFTVYLPMAPAEAAEGVAKVS